MCRCLLNLKTGLKPTDLNHSFEEWYWWLTISFHHQPTRIWKCWSPQQEIKNDPLLCSNNNIDYLCWGLVLLGPLQLPDGRASSIEDNISFLWPAKDVRTGGPDTPSNGFLLVLLSNILMFFLRPFSLGMLTFFDCVRAFYSARSFVPFNGGKTFWLVMMVLRWWQSHHYPAGDCQRL